MTLVPPQTFRKTDGIHRSGLAAARPAAADVLPGTLYASTDTGALERSDGSAWATFAGTVPTPLAATQLVGRGDSGSGAAQAITLSPSLIMTGTQLSVRTGIVNYTFNDTLTAPPAAGQCRLNAAYPWTAATKCWMRFISADGQDLYWAIMLLPSGATLLMQDKDDHTRYGRFTLTATPTDQGLYAELTVSWQANGTAVLTAQQIFLRVAGSF